MGSSYRRPDLRGTGRGLGDCTGPVEIAQAGAGRLEPDELQPDLEDERVAN